MPKFNWRIVGVAGDQVDWEDLWNFVGVGGVLVECAYLRDFVDFLGELGSATAAAMLLKAKMAQARASKNRIFR